jgi:hypothetical protein
MELKKFVTAILQEELGEYFINVEFDGPYEDEDLDAYAILREEPADLTERSIRISNRLWDAGFDVLILYDVEDDEEEDYEEAFPFSVGTSEKEKGVHKLTVKLPEPVYQSLWEKSCKSGKPLADVIVEILERHDTTDKIDERG